MCKISEKNSPPGLFSRKKVADPPDRRDENVPQRRKIDAQQVPARICRRPAQRGKAVGGPGPQPALGCAKEAVLRKVAISKPRSIPARTMSPTMRKANLLRKVCPFSLFQGRAGLQSGPIKLPPRTAKAGKKGQTQATAAGRGPGPPVRGGIRPPFAALCPAHAPMRPRWARPSRSPSPSDEGPRQPRRARIPGLQPPARMSLASPFGCRPSPRQRRACHGPRSQQRPGPAPRRAGGVCRACGRGSCADGVTRLRARVARLRPRFSPKVVSCAAIAAERRAQPLFGPHGSAWCQ